MSGTAHKLVDSFWGPTITTQSNMIAVVRAKRMMHDVERYLPSTQAKIFLGDESVDPQGGGLHLHFIAFLGCE